MRNAVVVLVALAAALPLTSCRLVDDAATSVDAGGDPAAPVGTEGLPDADEARTMLAGLTVTDRPRPASDYDRDAFGPSWRDVDGNGCNQRDDVLLRDAEPGSVRTGDQGSCDHDVLAGTWTDPYTARVLVLDDLKDPAQARAVQVDHVVPLAEAWVSGAAAWDDARREQYANDLRALLAVDGPTNASKGAGDPAAWRPRKAYQCAYAARWVATKSRWSLTVDPSEVAALEEMLATCAGA